MPRYVYGSFWDKVGNGLSMKLMLCVCIKASNMVGSRLDLFGHHAMAHLARLRSRCAHFEKFG